MSVAKSRSAERVSGVSGVSERSERCRCETRLVDLLAQVCISNEKEARIG